MKIILVSLLLFLSGNSKAQNWEFLTPLHNNDYITTGFQLNDTMSYLGGSFSRFLSTSDSGESWYKKYNTNSVFPIQYGIVGIHFTSIDTGYIVDAGGGVYRTIDANVTWQEIATMSPTFVNDLHVVSNDTAYVCGNNGALFVSTDSFLTWTPIATPVSDNITEMSFVSNSIFYLSTLGGDVLKTTDGGATFSTSYSGSTGLYSVDFEGSIGLAGGAFGTVIRTDDGGSTWNVISPGSQLVKGVYFLDPTTVLLACWNGQILRSSDAGLTFTLTPAATSNDLINFVQVNPTTIYCYGQSCVLESLDNGVTWNYRLDGHHGATIQRLKFNSSNNVAFAVGDSGSDGTLMKCTDGGRTWLTLNTNGPRTDLEWMDANNGFISENGYIRKTTDGGVNWSTQVKNGLNTSIYFLDVNTGFVGTYTEGLYKTINGGTSWTLVHPTSFTTEITDIYFCTAQIGLATLSNGTVIRTTDGGDNWAPTGAIIGFPISLEFTSPSTGYIGVTSNAILKTTDFGVTWTPITFGGIAVEFPDPSNIDSGYVLSDNAELFKTLDGGQTLTQVSSFDPNMQLLNDLTIHNGYAYASGGAGEIYRQKLPCSALYGSINVSSCSAYTAPDGQVLTTSGQYFATVQNGVGCDSIIAINLTVGVPTSSSLTITECDSYTAPDGQVYAASGQYSATIPNLNGCDSIISIDLTMNYSSNTNQTISACDSYTAPDGQVYTISGQYAATLPSSQGCDSTINIDLTIDNINASVTILDAITLEATPGGSAYQWVDCNNQFSPLNGETSQSYVSQANGDFAVIISQNGCIDTSSCYSITEVGLDAIDALTQFKIYPNPSHSIVFIELINVSVTGRIELQDGQGRVLYTSEVSEANHSIDLKELSNGVYYILIHTGDGVYRTSLIKI